MIILSISDASEDLKNLQFDGISTSYREKEIYIKRLKHPKCLQVAITPENMFGGDLANKNVPRECKKSFVTSVGVIQPIQIDSKILTVGELEILKFLQLLDFEPKKYALIDARRERWYKRMTIPHSINIPYSDIKYPKDFPEDFEKSMKELNVKIDKKGELNFTKAKEIIVFCNGSWCTQSAKMIKSLVKLGYPKKKLFWYRGGLQDWVGLGFTTQRP
jgi:rhodanese-related sulfurtransferase